MEIDATTAEQITRIAAAGYSPKQVAYALGIAPSLMDAWMADEDHLACVAYYKGLLSSELSVRESVMQLARNGSSPAQTLAMKIFEETRKQLRRERSE